MRLRLIVASAAYALLFAASTPALADASNSSAALAIQDAQQAAAPQATQPPPPDPQQRSGDVDINFVEDDTVWYTNPVWVAIGIIGVVVLGLLIGMVARGGGSSGGGSTIVK